jgi:NADPH-dependent 2,4-dienoyl-CoA reductase/sulfur reductase-like enzyme
VVAEVRSVVVVGASVAGLHVAEQLRAQGFEGSVAVVGSETHLPYDRPPLSKQVLLGMQTRRDVTFRTAAELDELRVTTHLGVPAVGWDGATLTLADGVTLTADRLVVATGVTPRSLPGQPEHPALGSLRTLDDAEWLAARLARGGVVAVVGGGFIGAEVASAARHLGCEVVVLEATELPLQRVLGAEAAALVARVLAEAGVDFRGGCTVSALVSDGNAIRIELGEAGSVRADTVVVGIGSVPQSAWLGLEGPGGIACDARGRVVDLPNAYAVGDVAAWPDARTGTPERTEHWTSARDQAAAVAADLVGRAPDPTQPAYFWTDQFGLKIQVIGRPDHADRVVVVGPEDGAVKRSVVLYLREGKLVGCALFSAARQLGRFTVLVRDQVDEATALAALAG